MGQRRWEKKIYRLDNLARVIDNSNCLFENHDGQRSVATLQVL